MTRYAHVMYCDDVRQELGGKVSFMGVYSGKLIASDVPGMLPKLCVAITLHSTLEEPFKDISVKGVYDGEEVFTMVLGEEEIQQAADQADKPPAATGYYVQLLAILTPFQIEKAGTFSIRILADGEKIKVPNLRIESVSPDVK